MAARFVMAVVVTGSPLTVTIEGASAVVAAEDFVGGLATDDRVQAAFLGDRLVVLARAGGAGDTAATANTLALRDGDGQLKAADGVAAGDVVTVNQLTDRPTIQSGYAQALGSGTASVDIAVTFPKAFAVGTLPVVLTSMHGYKGVTTTVSPDDVAPGAQDVLQAVQNNGLSRTAFTAQLNRSSGTFLASGKYLISWTAIGTLA